MIEFKATDKAYIKMAETEKDVLDISAGLPTAIFPSVLMKCIECGNPYWVAHWAFVNNSKCDFCKTKIEE